MGQRPACNPELPSQPHARQATCAYFDMNPAHNLMSFDNVGVAMISLMQSLTFDDWTVAMYALMDAFSSPWIVIFFLAIVVLGGFFVVNLFLAVIFEETLSAQMNEEIAARAEAAAAFVNAETKHAPGLAASSCCAESLRRRWSLRGGQDGGSEGEELL